MLVYGGDGAYERQGCRVLGWRELAAEIASHEPR
jgi:hypothetical protein